MPSSMRIGASRGWLWPCDVRRLCTQTVVVTQWLVDVHLFAEGKRIPCLSPQDATLVKTVSSKRQRL